MKPAKRLRTALLLYLVLGAWKGYLALFEAGQTEPRQIFPVLTADLPLEDREALEKGIIIRSDRALQKRLEAYLPQN